MLFLLPSVFLRTNRTSITLSLLASSIAKKSYVAVAEKEMIKVSPTHIQPLLSSEKNAHTCFSESPVPGRQVLWSDGTGDDEGEGKHDGEAEEQGEEEDCRSPVGEFGKTQHFLTALLLQLCC